MENDNKKPLYKAAIIGCGNAGIFHLNALRKFQDIVEVKMLCDIDESKLKRANRIYKSAEMTKDYIKVLENDEIDAVHICLPHYLHAKFTIDALNMGKHVLLEKPIANTLEECDQIIAAMEKSKKTLMIAENQRFLPAHIKIKELINSGIIGDVKLIHTYEGGSEVTSISDKNLWKSNIIEGGGGAWIDSGIHRVSVIQYLFGDVKSIVGIARRLYAPHETKADDNCGFVLELECGAICTIDVSFTVASEWNNTIEIFGTKGTILENHNWPIPIKLFSTLPGPNQSKWIDIEVEHKTYPGYYPLTFEAEIKHFYECLKNNSTPYMTAYDGRRALEVILMGYESSKTGRIIYKNKKN